MTKAQKRKLVARWSTEASKAAAAVDALMVMQVALDEWADEIVDCVPDTEQDDDLWNALCELCDIDLEAAADIVSDAKVYALTLTQTRS